ncbi:hypothetical protein N8I77_011505 [Diaporthe amygdali]|uniref:Uncharacterized protein n=1 Tax=Phomopsis amygdali TaxID=1214568 RepID=A0AAD9VYF5_PHOAM|nr:hypothetical protein N8I77_011505 [Diaporthe amygdali]
MNLSFFPAPKKKNLTQLHNMKLQILLTGGVWLLILSKAASAMPTTPLSATLNATVAQLGSTEIGHVNLEQRVFYQGTVEDQTNNYLFNMTLESFISLRDERYPSFGRARAYAPSAYQHLCSFTTAPTYHVISFQSMLTLCATARQIHKRSKNKISRNFKSDHYHQCATPGLQIDVCQACAEDPRRKDIGCKHRTNMCRSLVQDVCKCLGDTYYTAVQKFGRKEKRGFV